MDQEHQLSSHEAVYIINHRTTHFQELSNIFPFYLNYGSPTLSFPLPEYREARFWPTLLVYFHTATLLNNKQCSFAQTTVDRAGDESLRSSKITTKSEGKLTEITLIDRRKKFWSYRRALYIQLLKMQWNVNKRLMIVPRLDEG